MEIKRKNFKNFIEKFLNGVCRCIYIYIYIYRERERERDYGIVRLSILQVDFHSVWKKRIPGFLTMFIHKM